MTKVTLFSRLSLKAQAEINAMVKNKENAIDLIVNTFYGKTKATSNDISARFQVQYFAENPNLNSLQEDGKNGWWQNESYEGNEINSTLFPILETETTEEEWGRKFYSSFAVKYNGSTYRIKYPLDDDYTSSVAPFANYTVSDSSYNEVVRNIQNKLGIKVINGKASTLNLYKRNIFVLATTKIKNAGLKLAKKLDKTKTAFKGKLVLANETKGGYKYNNIEKIVKVYDSILKVGITKQVKYAMSKSKKNISKEMQFASRLFANILMSRITYFGDTEINKMVEKCLSLQLANVLNSTSFSSEQIKLMTKLATSTAVDTCKRLGYTTEKIMSLMTVNGYQYPKVPQDETEALLLAHKKDYTVYKSNLENTTLHTAKETDYGIIDGDEFYKIINAPIKTITPLESIKQSPETLTGVEKQGALNLGVQGYLEPTKMPALAGETAVVPAKNANDGEVVEDEKFIDKIVKKYGNLLDKVVTPKEQGNNIKYNQEHKREVRLLPPRTISEKHFRKLIDKYAEQVFTTQVVKVTNAINANRCSRYGGKETAKNLAYVLSMTLCFYKRTKIKLTKSSIKNYATIYSRSRQFGTLLVEQRNKIAKEMEELSSNTVRLVGENKPAYINRLAKQVCKAGDQEGLTLKQYFETYIKNVSIIYASGRFEDIHDTKANSK